MPAPVASASPATQTVASAMGSPPPAPPVEPTWCSRAPSARPSATQAMPHRGPCASRAQASVPAALLMSTLVFSAKRASSCTPTSVTAPAPPAPTPTPPPAPALLAPTLSVRPVPLTSPRVCHVPPTTSLLKANVCPTVCRARASWEAAVRHVWLPVSAARAPPPPALPVWPTPIC